MMNMDWYTKSVNFMTQGAERFVIGMDISVIYGNAFPGIGRTYELYI